MYIQRQRIASITESNQYGNIRKKKFAYKKVIYLRRLLYRFLYSR